MRFSVPAFMRRGGLLLTLFVVALVTTGASNTGSRFNDLGHKMICTCSCNEILLECNHVGCPNSSGMIDDLRTQLGSGANDSSILNAFVAKYGPTVLAAPIRGGFDNAAWIVPFVVFALAIGGTALLIRKWRGRHLITPDGTPVSVPDMDAHDAMRERIRREAEL